MSQPTLRWGSSGPAVRQLQEELTKRGYRPGPIDGRFGAATHNAVRAFQRDSGLTVDGVVGQRTWAALSGSPVPVNGDGGGGVPAGARGISLHIGVNRIDPAHYGTSGVLHGCEADAQAMAALATKERFEPRMLLTTEATSTQVLSAIRNVAGSLRSGDIFLLTYAGHGAQVEDLTGEEADDRLDETWCLYDRMVLDDELYALWAEFAAGVRIVVLSDSCHSGTVTRELVRETAILKEVYYATFQAPISTRAFGDEDPGIRGFLSSMPLPRDAAAANGARDFGGGGGAVVTRNLPQAYVPFIVQESGDLYRSLKAETSRAPEARATVLLISGCQDNQLSQESGGRGMFSRTLEAVWGGGTYRGSYRGLHSEIVARMPPTQTPNLTVVGAPNRQFESERPFTVAGSRETRPVEPTATPTAAPTLQPTAV